MAPSKTIVSQKVRLYQNDKREEQLFLGQKEEAEQRYIQGLSGSLEDSKMRLDTLNLGGNKSAKLLQFPGPLEQRGKDDYVNANLEFFRVNSI